MIVQNKVASLPLSGGKGLEDKFKQRKEQREQLTDLLPEYNSRGFGIKWRSLYQDYGSIWHSNAKRSHTDSSYGEVCWRVVWFSWARQPRAQNKSDDSKSGRSWSGYQIPKRKWLKGTKIGTKIRKHDVETRDTCWGMSHLFYTSVGKKNHRRSVGSVNFKVRVPTRISESSKKFGIKETTCSGQDVPIYQNEISNLLEKQVIEPVSIQNQNTGFYSTLFINKKKNGKLRPVTNLRPLNKYLLIKHFKMDT